MHKAESLALLYFIFMSPIVLLMITIIPPPMAQAYQCEVEAHFTPMESITQTILPILDNAQASVRVSLFGITSKTLADELVKLKQRGLLVEVFVDNKQSKLPSSLTSELTQAGIPVVVKPIETLEHNKIALIDENLPTATIITGSWNWSSNAEKQDNNDLIVRSCPGLIKQYQEELDYIKQRDTK